MEPKVVFRSRNSDAGSVERSISDNICWLLPSSKPKPKLASVRLINQIESSTNINSKAIICLPTIIH